MNQKELITLAFESDVLTQIDVDDFDGDLRTYIFDRCMDGANIFDFIALAIDQRGKEDGIDLIDEILTSINELPPGMDQEESLKEDAQAAALYMDIFNYRFSKDPNDHAIFTEAKIKLDELEYPWPILEFKDNGEPLGVIWASPDFKWETWYHGEYHHLGSKAKKIELITSPIRHLGEEEDEIDDVMAELITPSISIEFDDNNERVQDLQTRYSIGYNKTRYLSLDYFEFPIKSLRHLVIQIMDKTKIRPKAPTKTAFEVWSNGTWQNPQPFEVAIFECMKHANVEDTTKMINTFPDLFKVLDNLEDRIMDGANIFDEYLTLQHYEPSIEEEKKFWAIYESILMEKNGDQYPKSELE